MLFVRRLNRKLKFDVSIDSMLGQGKKMIRIILSI